MDVFCQSHCSQSCLNLKGNLTFECGQCVAPMECRPGAFGFDGWLGRHHLQKTVALPNELVEEGDILQSICPSNVSQLQTGVHALPILKRYCQRGAERCARVASALEWHLENIQPPDIRQTRAAILHRQRPTVGAGFAHVVQEQAMAILLGLVLDRPVLFHSVGGVFNRRGSLLGPEQRLRAAVYRRPANVAAGYSTFLFCRAAKERLAKSLVLPYRCERASDAASDDGNDGGNRWFLRLDDGMPWDPGDLLGKGKPARWNRFTHEAARSSIFDYIPKSHPVLFSSPSIINMYLADFLLADDTVKRERERAAPSTAPPTALQTAVAAFHPAVLASQCSDCYPLPPLPSCIVRPRSSTCRSATIAPR